MAMITFQDLPSTSTPLNAANLNNNFSEILNLICPVGKVEVFFDNSDHSNYLGFTWERTCVGRMPIGYNSNDSDFSTIGNTGGSKTHTQTRDEVANHTHQLWVTNDSGDSYGTSPSIQWSRSRDSWTNTQFGVERTDTQNASPMNIMNPYQVVAFWKRTA